MREEIQHGTGSEYGGYHPPVSERGVAESETQAKGSDRELLDEQETLSIEVKALMEQLPTEKKHMLETYLEKMMLLLEKDGDYLYFQGAKDCMELFGKLGQAREKK